MFFRVGRQCRISNGVISWGDDSGVVSDGIANRGRNRVSEKNVAEENK